MTIWKPDVFPRHEISTHSLSSYNGTDERDPFGYYYYRVGCGEVFCTTTTRDRFVPIYKDAENTCSPWNKLLPYSENSICDTNLTNFHWQFRFVDFTFKKSHANHIKESSFDMTRGD